MSYAIAVWLRRCIARLAFPAMVVIGFLDLSNRSGWNHEWDWALTQASTGSLLIAPLLAGLVAYERSRRLEPTLTLIGNTTARGSLSMITMVIASWIWACLAWLVVISYAAIRAWVGGATGVPNPWVFIETPILLALAASLGLLFGSLIQGVLAAPVVTVTFFLMRVYAAPLGLPGAFGVGNTTGTLVALERDPANAAATVILHVALAVAAGLVALRGRVWIRSDPMSSIAGLAVGLVCVIAATTLFVHVTSTTSIYRRVVEAEVCTHSSVVVCGPRKAAFLLHASSEGLDAAVDGDLKNSGIIWEQKYVLLSGQAVDPSGGVLTANPEDISHGRISHWDVISTLVNPRLCADLMNDQTARPLLADQDTVGQWLDSHLADHAETNEAAPPAVREAYLRLKQCTPALRLPS